MEKNDIKKILYRNKISAFFSAAKKGNLEYTATIFDIDEKTLHLLFVIPFSDIGDAAFFQEMEAKLLIRWLQ